MVGKTPAHYPITCEISEDSIGEVFTQHRIKVELDIEIIITPDSKERLHELS